jgi:Muconolactone delta-isomerase
MKRTMRAALAAGLAWIATAASGQAQTQQFPAPTTHILAIGTITPGASLASVRAILPTEVRETVKLYLAGKIDQWFSLADRNGVVFLLDVKDTQEAHAMLEALPLGQAHLMQFELLPLAPLAPLRQLLGVADGSP